MLLGALRPARTGDFFTTSECTGAWATLRIVDALKRKRIVLFSTSDSAINLQQTDVDRLLELAGLGGKRG